MNTSLKLSSLLDNETSLYFNALDKRTKEQVATIKLLNTSFKDVKKNHVLLSGLDKSLSGRFIHSMNQTGASIWILDLLAGKPSICPVPKNAGLYGNSIIQYFLIHHDMIVDSCKPAPKKEKVETPAPTLQALPDMINDTDAEQAPTQSDLDYVFEQWLTLSDSDKGAFAKMVTKYNKAAKQALAQVG